MSYEPSPQQALAIFSMVFGERDESRRPDMKALGLSPSQRAALVEHGFLELEKAGRGQRATLTDKGWAWAANNLRATLEQKSPAAKALCGVLARLDQFLHERDVALAEFIGPPPEAAPVELSARVPAKAKKKRSASKSPKKKRSKKAGRSKAKRSPKAKPKAAKTKRGKRERPSKAPAKPKPRSKRKRGAPPKNEASKAGSESLAGRIRTVALALGGGATRTRVRLSQLRKKLADVPREQIDRELFALQIDGGLVLYRIDDSNDLDVDDVRAALDVAGSPRHVLYLEN